MSETAIVKKEETGILPVDKETIRNFLDGAQKGTEQELTLFINICKMFKLNPFKKEIYFVKFGEKKADFIVGYEVYVKRAEASGNWDGMEEGLLGSIATGDFRAWVKVYRKDWKYPYYHEALFSEYDKGNYIWKQMPATMITKVARAQGLRLAFPNEVGELPYVREELKHVDDQRMPDAVDYMLQESPETKEKEAKAVAESEARAKEFDLLNDGPSSHEQQTEIDRLMATLVDKHKSDPGQMLLAIKNDLGVEVIKAATETQAKAIISYLTDILKRKEHGAKVVKK